MNIICPHHYIRPYAEGLLERYRTQADIHRALSAPTRHRQLLFRLSGKTAGRLKLRTNRPVPQT
ncbi:MAG: hypothetical protein OXH85_12030 [Truepera sp.]|nr:hypothetical protein [Truepera sp.]